MSNYVPSLTLSGKRGSGVSQWLPGVVSLTDKTSTGCLYTVNEMDLNNSLPNVGSRDDVSAFHLSPNQRACVYSVWCWVS